MYTEITEYIVNCASTAMKINTQQSLCNLLYKLMTSELVRYQSPAVYHITNSVMDGMIMSGMIIRRPQRIQQKQRQIL